MEESDGLYGDPCDYYGHLYDHFLQDEPCGPLPEDPIKDPKLLKGRRRTPSMLVKGFGMRNLESLQRALLDDEQRRKMLLAKHGGDEEYECTSISSSSTSYLVTKTSFTSTHVPVSAKSSRKSLSLQYLMGLEDAAEEGAAAVGEMVPPLPYETMEGEVEDEALKKMTAAMRRARKYLRQHRIFDLFKFIIAHMLGEMPENPIEFIMDLLDKCLLYRSGFGNPPLLFEKPHIGNVIKKAQIDSECYVYSPEQLFYMMDRMRTGFVDMEQYESGMKTLGICSYDKNPPLTTEGLISKEFFVEEAYECLTDLLVEMIRSHAAPTTPPSFMTPPPTLATDLMDAA